METNDANNQIKEKYRQILELKVKDNFYQLSILVDDILKLINELMVNEQDEIRINFLFMKYSALVHTRHKEVGYVINQPRLSRTVLLEKLKVAIDQIYLDLLGLL
jgi:hypothetical protein